MNGRVYDYNLGRFMSVDPLIMNFEDSQGINPYSYIRNNPLAGTDPSGYCEAATGTRIKSCGDMKVEVKATMKDGSTKVVGSAVVKDVNFANGASRNAAMAQGVNAIGGAMKAMDIGAQKQLGTNTADPTGGNVKGTASPTAGTLDKMLETAEGVGKAAVGSLKRGGLIGLALTPSMMGDGELSAENQAMMQEKIKENGRILGSMIEEARERGDNYLTIFRTASPVETADIQSRGVFAMGPLLFPKQFSLNLQDAKAFSESLPLSDRPFSIFSARISLRTAYRMMPNTDPVRGYGTIFYLTAQTPSVLNSVNNDLKRTGGITRVE